jgi:glycine/D-amino acid oxidase-like deaminating enzyme/nitrite reductase/ring-hydroxylating ferredoxin subunit
LNPECLLNKSACFSFPDHSEKELGQCQTVVLSGAAMNVFDEQTRSLWMDFKVTTAPVLDCPEQADVAIVGAGIAGLSVAYELLDRGQSVVVLDRGEIGSGMTARTTAHLATALDDNYSELIKARGLDCARLFYQSVKASIDRIAAIQTIEDIDCDFSRLDGYWVLAPTTPASELDNELKACGQIGVPVEDCREQTALHAERLVRSLRFPGQARFHPAKYVAGLAAAIKRKGGRMFRNTCVESIERKQGKMVLDTDSGHKVRAAKVVVATNSPVNVRVAIHSKQGPYRTYAIAAKLPKDALKDALYWDTLDPYHYVRLQPLSQRQDMVIIGGEDHKSGEADDGDRRFAALDAWSRDHIPNMGEITHRWSGQVLEPADFVGFIGKSPGDDNVFIVSGDSGQGLTNGVVAGMLIADLSTTGNSAWKEVYDPARKLGNKITNFISENITPLKNFAEYLSAAELESVKKLKPGDGRIVRSGLKKLAACRDQNGRLHVHSASCTHLGCIVHWNSLEQCWDCPCHGSQFAPDGTALNGPAVSSLAKFSESDELHAAE